MTGHWIAHDIQEDYFLVRMKSKEKNTLPSIITISVLIICRVDEVPSCDASSSSISLSSS